MCVSAVSKPTIAREYLFGCEQISNQRRYEARAAAFHAHGQTQMPHPQLKLLRHSIY